MYLPDAISIFLVAFKSIESLHFPAVTVCAPNSRRWTAFTAALQHFDKDGLIYDALRKYHNKEYNANDVTYALKSFDGYMQKNSPYDPTLLTLDRSLPEKLELLPIEREIFFLIHYSCWKSGWNWHWSSSKSGDCDSIKSNLPRHGLLYFLWINHSFPNFENAIFHKIL